MMWTYCSNQTNPSRWVLAMCSSIEAGRNWSWLRESGVVFINRIVFLTFEILVIISLSRDFTSNDFRTNVCSILVINHRFRSLPNVMYILYTYSVRYTFDSKTSCSSQDIYEYWMKCFIFTHCCQSQHDYQ